MTAPTDAVEEQAYVEKPDIAALPMGPIEGHGPYVPKLFGCAALLAFAATACSFAAETSRGQDGTSVVENNLFENLPHAIQGFARSARHSFRSSAICLSWHSDWFQSTS